MMVDQDNKKFKEVYTEIPITNQGEQHKPFSLCVFNIAMVVDAYLVSSVNGYVTDCMS